MGWLALLTAVVVSQSVDAGTDMPWLEPNAVPVLDPAAGVTGPLTFQPVTPPQPQPSVDAGVSTLDGGVAPPSPPAPDVLARRTEQRISVDGRVEEAAWADAEVFSSFVESFPNTGRKADLRTEVRVLYDHTYLYVSVVCTDPQPDTIIRSLGRRDSAPVADTVEIGIDSSNDRRTAYAFIVNAGGTQRDRLLYADVNVAETWDAVWDAASTITATGWSTELAIPLRALRFEAGTTEWGFLVRRTVPRTHQVLDSRMIPREANQFLPGGVVVSRFGRLTGLVGLEPGRDIEITPYLAARGALRPQYSDETTPTPRMFEPSADLGLDFKMALTSKISLTAALNPDFGQVEADALIQNVSTQEQFFPEKRPFFLQGLDLFAPSGSEYGSPMQMFYSRRIGLQAPILGAVKVAGTAWEGLDVGFLDVVVMGAGNPSMVPIGYAGASPSVMRDYESRPDRRFQFHLTQPLHFGLNSALPPAHPVTTNYLAAVARQRFWENSSVGLVFTAATPMGERCNRREFATQEEFDAAGCFTMGGNALALDWNLRTSNNEWGFFGQLNGTQQVFGDPNGRLLADGTVMKPGDLGYGGYLRAGKLGGAPFRADVSLVYESPKLDMNAVGFQPLSNYVWADLDLHLVQPNGIGPFRNFSLDYNLDLNWSTDGRKLPRGLNTRLESQVQLPSFDSIGVVVGLENEQYDVREIYGSGTAFQRLPDVFVAAFAETDRQRRLTLDADIFGYRLFGIGQQPGGWGWGLDATAIWHPIDALETRLDVSYANRQLGARWVDTIDDGATAVFGSQDPTFLSFTLRQSVILTPRLSFQLYAQLFSGAVRYNAFWSAQLREKQFISADQVSPFAYAGNAATHFSQMQVNAVMRWEYRLGSTLFLVYTRSQQEQVRETVESNVWPSKLFGGPAIDTFMVKWTYWFSV